MTAPSPGAPRRSRGQAIGWSLLFLSGGVVLSGAIYLLADLVLPPRTGLLGDALLQSAAMLLAFGALTWGIGLGPAGLTPADLRWNTPRTGLRGFGVGFLAGLVPALAAMGLGAALGTGRWSHDGGTAMEWVSAVAATGAVLLPAALAEEMVFRGVPLVLLAGILGRAGAGLLLAVLFALAHLLNPGVTPLAVGNIALAGVFLTACFYLPGGLWTATGAHLGWNLGLAAFAAPVSGLPLEMPLVDYAPGDPVWLTGGGFGPEGGVLATGVFLIATLLVGRHLDRGRVA